MGQGYLKGSGAVIAQELQDLFDDLKRELIGMKTDLVIVRYDLEQLDKKLDEVKLLLESPPIDPYEGKIVEKF